MKKMKQGDWRFLCPLYIAALSCFPLLAEATPQENISSVFDFTVSSDLRLKRAKTFLIGKWHYSAQNGLGVNHHNLTFRADGIMLEEVCYGTGEVFERKYFSVNDTKYRVRESRDYEDDGKIIYEIYEPTQVGDISSYQINRKNGLVYYDSVFRSGDKITINRGHSTKCYGLHD
jgi:hypothetical protein